MRPIPEQLERQSLNDSIEWIQMSSIRVWKNEIIIFWDFDSKFLNVS